MIGVEGRSLSLATGLLSETTVWDFLRTIRDRPGAPLVRTRPAQGRDADFYALTRQNPALLDDAALVSARVEDVHPAWKSSATGIAASTNSSSTGASPTLTTSARPRTSAPAPGTPAWPPWPPQDSSGVVAAQ